MKTLVMLMFGGKGERLGADVPKQYIEVNGKPLFAYSLEALEDMDEIHHIIAVTNQDYLDYTQDYIKSAGLSKVAGVVPGGRGRSADIQAALETAREFAEDEDVILFFDATHPFVDRAGTRQVIEAIQAFGAATLAAFQYDTTYMIAPEEGTLATVVPREALIAGASPEGFRFGDIYRIYTEATPEELGRMTSAGAIALQHGIPMKAVRSTVLNLKITFQEDLELFRLLAGNYCSK